MLRSLIIAKDEELLVHDGSAYRSAFLVTVKSGRCVGLTRKVLALFVEIFICRYDLGAKYCKSVAMVAVSAGLAHQADDARATALVGGRSVLGLHAELGYGILSNM